MCLLVQADISHCPFKGTNRGIVFQDNNHNLHSWPPSQKPFGQSEKHIPLKYYLYDNWHQLRWVLHAVFFLLMCFALQDGSDNVCMLYKRMPKLDCGGKKRLNMRKRWGGVISWKLVCYGISDNPFSWKAADNVVLSPSALWLHCGAPHMLPPPHEPI